MRQPRVRRPFSVETRGSGRDGNSIAIPKRVPPSPQTTRKGSTEAARPVFDPWAAVTAPPEPVAQRRILPNIMAPPEPASREPEVEAPVAETPLPKVRRANPRVAALAPRAKAPVAKTPVVKTPGAKTPGAKTPGAKTPIAMPPVAAAPAPRPLPAVAAKPVAEKSDAAMAPLVRMALREGRTGRAALPAGQRWKARLPRACW